MPRVRFTKNFDFHVPGKPVTVAYKANWSGLVTTPCAQQAIAKGAAMPVGQVERPPIEQADIENADTSDGG